MIRTLNHNEAETAAPVGAPFGRPNVADLIRRDLAKFDRDLESLPLLEGAARVSGPHDIARLKYRSATIRLDAQIDGLQSAVRWMKKRRGVTLPEPRERRRR